MAASFRDEGEWPRRARRGTGSVRQRRPGVWEIRVVVAFDPVVARSVQRSFTVHGDEDLAMRRRSELVADFGVTRVNFPTGASRLTVGGLMERFFEAPHLWKPATVGSHRPVVRALTADAFGRRRLIVLTHGDVRAAMCRWQADGLSVATVSARWLVLRSAMSWAVAEGVLRTNPLAGMRGPPRPEPRKHHSPAEVRRLLGTAEALSPFEFSDDVDAPRLENRDHQGNAVSVDPSPPPRGSAIRSGGRPGAPRRRSVRTPTSGWRRPRPRRGGPRMPSGMPSRPAPRWAAWSGSWI